MTLISIIVNLALYGFLVWLVFQIPMPGALKNIICGVAGLIAVLWALQYLGIATGLPHLRLR